MKHCPKCDRTYTDETLNFCLDDGEWLRADDESATAILSEPGAVATGSSSSEAATKAQIHTTERTAMLPGGLTEQNSSANRAAKPLVILGILVLLLAGGFFGYRYIGSGEKRIESIAVLPFENKSGDADSEYLSDGLSDTLIYRLSQLSNLKVTPRSLVYRYKGKSDDAIGIAKELNVDAIMSGRILQRGDQLTISVELVDVRNNKLIWGDQYDRKLSDLLATQRDIAREIVNNLKIPMAGGEAPLAVTKQYTANNEAYQLYLKGRFNWNKRTRAGYEKAIEFFQQAIEQDPAFALAYVGVAEAEYLNRNTNDSKPARAAVQRALDIDPSLGEAHNILALIKFHGDWDFAGAEAEWKRSLELNPNYATTHHWYAEALGNLGRFDESFAEYNRAQELDPLSMAIGTDRCQAFTFARQYDRAVECLKKLLEVDPNFGRTHEYLGSIYEMMGKFEEAVSEFERSEQLKDGGQVFTEQIKPVLLNALKTGGEKAYWEATLRLILDRAEKTKSPFDTGFLAQVYSMAGDRDKAFEILYKAVAERDITVSIKVDPYFDNLRGDSRFQELLKKIGLPE